MKKSILFLLLLSSVVSTHASGKNARTRSNKNVAKILKEYKWNTDLLSAIKNDNPSPAQLARLNKMTPEKRNAFISTSNYDAATILEEYKKNVRIEESKLIANDVFFKKCKLAGKQGNASKFN